MMNVIKADLYRIFRGRMLYITFGIVAIIFILFRGAGMLGVTIGGSLMNAQGTRIENQFNGMEAPFIPMMLMDFLAYLILAVIIFVVSSDFSSNTVRNTLSTDVSRIKYYLSKLITAVVFCIALASFSVIVSTILGSLADGFGGELSGEYIVSVLKPFGAQLFLLICLTCVGVSFAMITKNTTATAVSFLAFAIVPDIVIQYYLDFATYRSGVLDAAAQYEIGLGELSVYSITGSIRNMVFATDLPRTTVILTLTISAFYAVASTIIGILLFRRSAIK